MYMVVASKMGIEATLVNTVSNLQKEGFLGVWSKSSSGASLLIMSARRRCVSTVVRVFCRRVVLARVAGALLDGAAAARCNFRKLPVDCRDCCLGLV